MSSVLSLDIAAQIVRSHELTMTHIEVNVETLAKTYSWRGTLKTELYHTSKKYANRFLQDILRGKS